MKEVHYEELENIIRDYASSKTISKPTETEKDKRLPMGVYIKGSRNILFKSK